MDPVSPAISVAPTGAPTRLRNLTAAVVTGSDGPTLATAVQALFDAGGESVLISVQRIADYEVLVIYSE